MGKREDIKAKLKEIIVKRLELNIEPEQIEDSQPLFGEEERSLGLDSVEALELVVGIEEEFGVLIQDEEGVVERFYCIDTLSELVEEMLGRAT